ncbi:hypothetical protein D9611_004941 [Ephemerocybe angulata]|uniref:Uncharacterized protein n=1 Tax=Ephemerocybe angulata TaxID=980116 RepID=A0A8H5B2X4_9AGAR|nr:hypothetical protein D9611_004941 [Tulosesus angulatus]
MPRLNAEALRDKLLNSSDGSRYYAEDGLTSLLTWFKTADFDRVVLKEEVERYEEARMHYCGDTSVQPPSAPPALVMTAIVRLSSHWGYFMTACSKWTPVSKIPFKSARASALAEDSGLPELHGEFETGLAMLSALTDQLLVGSNVESQANGVIEYNLRSGRPGFKIGHKLFEPRTYNGVTRSEDDDPDYRIENWPVTRQAMPALEKVKASHIANPIPAYNEYGLLIHPTRYEAQLKGAVVKLSFVLNHWCIDHKDSFNLDVIKIRVLVPPPPLDTPTPKRNRQVARRDDSQSESSDSDPPTPSKKPKHRGARGNK